jgi:hypothetical protein
LDCPHQNRKCSNITISLHFQNLQCFPHLDNWFKEWFNLYTICQIQFEQMHGLVETLLR